LKFDATDDFFQKVFPKNNILALKEDVEDDASDSGLVGSTVCWHNRSGPTSTASISWSA
jgi:hypothetical protein